MTRTRKATITFGFVEGLFWVCYCTIFSFLVLYLAENGFTSVQIGFAMTVLSLVAIVATLAEGYISDFYVPIKKLVTTSLVVTIPVSFLLKSSVSVVPLALLSIGALSLCIKPVGSLLDGWGMRLSLKLPRFNFASARAFGSLTFAIAAISLGKIYDMFSLDLMFYFHVVFAILALIAVSFLESVPIAEQSSKISYPKVLKELFKIKQYFILIVCITLANMTQVGVSSFGPVLMKSLGGTNFSYGMMLFVMSSSELPIMFLFYKISEKYKLETLVLVSLLFIFFRSFVYVFIPNVPLLICAQAIQSLSYGLYLPTVLRYVCKITPNNLHASAITIAFAFSEGIAGIFGNALGGYISDMLGVRFVFLILSVGAVLAFSIFFISTKSSRSNANIPE